MDLRRHLNDHPRAALATAAALGAAAGAGATSPLRRAVELPAAIAALADRRRVAVVPLRGVIGGALRAVDVSRQLERLRKDANIRAVLLDIDSPGGGAIESEALYLAVKRLAAVKPVVAWIRGTGASGSYFLACGATRILAFPSAIVGSIGVISARPILVDVLRRIGAQVQVTKTGPLKDMGAPWREPTDLDRAKEQSLIDGIFKRFSGVVAAARDFDDAQLATVTTGEVWLAEEALSLGLVDGLAEEEDALDAVHAAAGLSRRRVIRVQRHRTLAQRLGLPAIGGDSMGGFVAELEGWLAAPRLMS